jgi:hypothetical protein
MDDALMDLNDLRDLYSDVELTILFRWLGRALPPALMPIVNAPLAPEADEDEPDDTAFWLRAVHADGEALDNAVACLVLNGIVDELPAWGVSWNDDGEKISARGRMPRRGGSKMPLVPRFQFTINWANGAFGYTWPEAYYATDLPGFGGSIVTASADAPECFGEYTDLAIGYCPAAEDQTRGIERLIQAWWRERTGSDLEQAWEEIWAAGAVTEAVAASWAREVWGVER